MVIFYVGKTHNRPFQGFLPGDQKTRQLRKNPKEWPIIWSLASIQIITSQTLEPAVHWYFYISLRPYALNFYLFTVFCRFWLFCWWSSQKMRQGHFFGRFLWERGAGRLESAGEFVYKLTNLLGLVRYMLSCSREKSGRFGKWACQFQGQYVDRGT